MLGTLVRGRVGVGGAATSATKVAQTIAVRHAGQRLQFTTPEGDEARLLDYPAHRRKLRPALARSIAFTFAQAELVGAFARHEPGTVHARSRLMPPGRRRCRPGTRPTRTASRRSRATTPCGCSSWPRTCCRGSPPTSAPATGPARRRADRRRAGRPHGRARALRGPYGRRRGVAGDAARGTSSPRWPRGWAGSSARGGTPTTRSCADRTTRCARPRRTSSCGSPRRSRAKSRARRGPFAASSPRSSGCSCWPPSRPTAAGSSSTAG